MNILIDTSWVMYRSIYTYPDFSVERSGVSIPTGHLYGVIKLVKALTSDPNNYLIFVRDLQPVEKKENLPSYKDNRSHGHNVHADFTGLASLFDSVRVIFIEKKDSECDDVIAFLASHYNSKGIKTCVYSGDNDFLPLGSLPNVFISRQIVNNKPVPLESIYWLDKWGVSLESIPTYRTLTGDSSDNIKGLPRFPKDIARHIATIAPDFNSLKDPEIHKVLMEEFGTTPSRRKHILSLRTEFTRLLRNFNMFMNVLNVQMSISDIEYTQKRFTSPQIASRYYGLQVHK